MTLVKEHIIFEKFTENSDPIEDMGIGMKKVMQKKLDSIENMCKQAYDNNFKKYCDDSYDKFFIELSRTICVTIDRILKDPHFLKNKQKIFNKVSKEEINSFTTNKTKEDKIKIRKKAAEILKKEFYINLNTETNLFEKFTEDSDPISDMGIGIFNKLEIYSLKKLAGKTNESLLICDNISNMMNLPLTRIYFLDNYAHFMDVDSKIWNLLLKNAKLLKEKYFVNYRLELYVNDNKFLLIEKCSDHINIFGDVNAAIAIYLNETEEINEEFTEEGSDPIHDMGIGLEYTLRKTIPEKFKISGRNPSVKNSKRYFGTEKYPEEAYAAYVLIKKIIENNDYSAKGLQKIVDFSIKNTLHKYGSGLNVNMEKVFDALNNFYGIKTLVWKPSKLHEKFTEDSDPITDMGIGAEAIISNYLKKIHIYNIETYKFGSLYGYDAILCDLIHLNNLEIVPLLLKSKKANPRAQHSLSLRWASGKGNIEMIKLLIKYGADPNDSDGGNSLDCAIVWESEEAIKYLLKIKTKTTTGTSQFVKEHIDNKKLKEQILKLCKKENNY
jgi:hypothetical protein